MRRPAPSGHSLAVPVTTQMPKQYRLPDSKSVPHIPGSDKCNPAAGGQVIALDSTATRDSQLAADHHSGPARDKSLSFLSAEVLPASRLLALPLTWLSYETFTSMDWLGSNTGLSFTGAATLVVQNCTFKSLTTGISVTERWIESQNGSG